MKIEIEITTDKSGKNCGECRYLYRCYRDGSKDTECSLFLEKGKWADIFFTYDGFKRCKACLAAEREYKHMEELAGYGKTFLITHGKAGERGDA